jgi:hypothetical protein
MQVEYYESLWIDSTYMYQLIFHLFLQCTAK